MELEELEKEIMGFIDGKEVEYVELYKKTHKGKYAEQFAIARYGYITETKSMRDLIDKSK